jgi:hypothetical protein
MILVIIILIVVFIIGIIFVAVLSIFGLCCTACCPAIAALICCRACRDDSETSAIQSFPEIPRRATHGVQPRPRDRPPIDIALGDVQRRLEEGEGTGGAGHSQPGSSVDPDLPAYTPPSVPAKFHLKSATPSAPIDQPAKNESPVQPAKNESPV